MGVEPDSFAGKILNTYGIPLNGTLTRMDVDSLNIVYSYKLVGVLPDNGSCLIMLYDTKTSITMDKVANFLADEVGSLKDQTGRAPYYMSIVAQKAFRMVEFLSSKGKYVKPLLDKLELLSNQGMIQDTDTIFGMPDNLVGIFRSLIGLVNRTTKKRRYILICKNWEACLADMAARKSKAS